MQTLGTSSKVAPVLRKTFCEDLKQQRVKQVGGLACDIELVLTDSCVNVGEEKLRLLLGNYWNV